MALLLARRQDPPRPFYHPNKLNQLGEDVRAQIRDQLDQRWHPVVQATFFTYMMKRMDDFGLSKKNSKCPETTGASMFAVSGYTR